MAIIEDVVEEGEQNPGLRSRKIKKGKKATARTVDDIPLVHPAELPASTAPPLLTPSRKPSPTPSEIDEALRSGRLPNPLNGEAPEERERDGWDDFFDTLLMVIPFTSLYLLLDILVYLQYSIRPKLPDLVSHLLRAFPTISAIVYYTSKYPSHWSTNSALMSASILSGARLIWLMNKGSWGIVTAQAPAMGTLWTLTIVQLPLARAIICLAIVGGWVWWSGLSLQP